MECMCTNVLVLSNQVVGSWQDVIKKFINCTGAHLFDNGNDNDQ